MKLEVKHQAHWNGNIYLVFNNICISIYQIVLYLFLVDGESQDLKKCFWGVMSKEEKIKNETTENNYYRVRQNDLTYL